MLRSAVIAIALVAAFSGCAGGTPPAPLAVPGSVPAVAKHPAYFTTGDVAVANDDPITGTSSVYVYAPFRTWWLTIARDVKGPTALAFNRDGVLFVANRNHRVTTFADGNVPGPVITEGIASPRALAVDGSNRVYVANHGANTVTVYDRNDGLVRTIAHGIDRPVSIAVERSGLLAVANSNGTVTEYGAGSDSPLVTLRDGVHEPGGVVFDAHGRLFVANGNGTVTQYVRGMHGPERTIVLGPGLVPAALAVRPSTGNLYVVAVDPLNGGHGSLDVFAPSGSTAPVRTIGANLSEPMSLAFATTPDERLYVGNAKPAGAQKRYDVAVFDANDAPAGILSADRPSAIAVAP